nr:integrase, catalytic region, zinc finger, CCHC-type, peptidase aspartic, catalytic [Tanacetum cinerariifolium]
MVINNLDLEPKVDVMMRDFLHPSWWKELIKETSSKILPCGDGSCWKTFKPRRQKLDAVVVRDFYKKFYNSLGRVPNRCSSSIGKTRRLLSFSRGIASKEKFLRDVGALLGRNEVVKVRMPKCMSFLDAYGEPICDLDLMKDKVDNPSPQSTPQVLSSFEVYLPPVTYLEEVEKTFGTPMEVEPLDHIKIEYLDLDTYSYDLFLSFREVPSFDEPKPQPNPLPSCPPLDVCLRYERGLEPPIKPHSPDNFRMKVVHNLTILTPPSPHVPPFYPKNVYCYYHPCIDDPKKHYRFKPANVAAMWASGTQPADASGTHPADMAVPHKLTWDSHDDVEADVVVDPTTDVIEKGVNILKSIDEGPFQMGTFRDTLAEEEEDALHLGLEQPRIYSDLSPKDKERYNADIRATNILLQGLPKYIYTLINHYTDGNNARGRGAVGNVGAQYRVRNVNQDQERHIKCYNYNGIGHIARNCTQPKRPHNLEYFKDKMLLMQAQENGVVLDEEQLLFIADNVFQADECDVFDSDVDEAPTTQTMFMANLSSVDPVYDEVGLSYDSDILFEVHDHDNYQDAVCELHEVHEMHDNVQPNYVVESDADYTSDSNIIPYDQEVHLDYLKHLKESVETLREIVEEARGERPLDISLASTCLYTKHPHDLSEYVVGTCPKDFNKRDKTQATTPFNRKMQVTFVDQCETLNNNTQKHAEQLNIQKTNVHVIPSTRVNSCTDASGSKPRNNTKKNRISPTKSVSNKKVEEHPKTNKSSLKKENHVDSSISSKRTLDLGMIVLVLSWVMEIMLSVIAWSPGKHLCYVRDTDGVELIMGSRGSNLYTISVEDMLKSSPICLLSKASKNKSWLWHQPPRVKRSVSPATAALVSVISAGTPCSTTIDQDAPSSSHSPSSFELQPPISHQGVAAGSTIIKDNHFAHADNDPFVNVFAPDLSSEASSSGDASSAEPTHVTQPHHHIRK